MLCVPKYDVYFGGKLAMSKGLPVVTDRLGSVRTNSVEQMRYYPYGEERTSTADGREKFGTYFRDNPTQDYADQRYYAVGMGRFNSADPLGMNAASPANPGSWNGYSYVGGDPTNFTDETGLDCDDAERGDLTAKIKRYIYGSKDNKGIIQRVNEQITGKYDPGTVEWDNHNDQITGRQNSLRDLLNKWNTDDCGDGGPPDVPNAWNWATRGAVKPEEYIGPPSRFGPARYLNLVNGIFTIGVGVLSQTSLDFWNMDNFLNAVAAAGAAATAAAPSVTSKVIWLFEL
jgi:RHS repeat-associated protein